MASVLFACSETADKNIETALAQTPNIILIMADDLGWGDVGYNKNHIIKTPALDKMAKEGVQFNRFYSASTVCSPTRGSCITGRNAIRFGVYKANVGHLKKKERTLAELLKDGGYKTGHFGKWHLGTLSRFKKDGKRGGLKNIKHYAPPWEHGFDVCFSTESSVPLWNPMITPPSSAGIGNRTPGEPFGTAYWSEKGERVTENLEGNDSKIIMDRVVPFIENSVKDKIPFFAVIWFHAPHLPVLTGEQYTSQYKEHSEDIQHYYGCITAMDEQIGRLRNLLRTLNANENTVIFFNSDNGPEGAKPEGRTQGSAANLRGRKRSLYEGGIRVPGILVWPAKIKEHIEINLPVTTSDFLPTIIEITGIRSDRILSPLDGISLIDIIEAKTTKRRNNPVFFQYEQQLAVITYQYKLYSADSGETFEMYDLVLDTAESNNIIDRKSKEADAMLVELIKWQKSCFSSEQGNDY